MPTINAENTSLAWLKAIKYLVDSGGECYNLVVNIDRPLEIEEGIHEKYEKMLSDYDLRSLKQVIYTVFPYSLYLEVNKDRNKLFDRYNKPRGVYDRLAHQYKGKFGWGSYFRRMTYYQIADDNSIIVKNQLAEIITMLNERERVYKSAYFIVIPIPGVDYKRVMGGPCLHYLTLQLDNPKVLNLSAIYRNHDFIQRAYGNYLSLGYLMEFICDQTEYTMGKLHCMSSHASLSNLGGADSWPSNRVIRSIIGQFE